MCVYVYVCIYICIYVCVYMYICMYMCVYMYVYIYVCVCEVLWDLFCPHLCCPQASIVRSFWDQGLVRSGATDGRGLAVCVYVTVNNINMGVI